MHVRGFFPIVRLSRRFAEAYRAEVTAGWAGHFEALYPTIAVLRSLSDEDIGGTGPFVPEGRRGLWYWNTYEDRSRPARPASGPAGPANGRDRSGSGDARWAERRPSSS
jgi:hypothetical protein